MWSLLLDSLIVLACHYLDCPSKDLEAQKSWSSRFQMLGLWIELHCTILTFLKIYLLLLKNYWVYCSGVPSNHWVDILSRSDGPKTVLNIASQVLGIARIPLKCSHLQYMAMDEWYLTCMMVSHMAHFYVLQIPPVLWSLGMLELFASEDEALLVKWPWEWWS